MRNKTREAHCLLLWLDRFRSSLKAPGLGGSGSMSSRYIGLTAAGCAAVGAAVTLQRLRTLALIPKIFRSSDSGGTVPSTEPSNTHTLFVVGLLWSIDKLVGRALRLVRLAGLPSSIVSLLLSYGGLTVIDIAIGKHAAERVLHFFQPGVTFLGRWMMAVYTVSIVPLPSNLGAFRGLGDFALFSALHAGSWLFAISTTGILVKVLTGGRKHDEYVGGEAAAAGSNTQSNQCVSPVKVHRTAVRSVWTTLTAASYALIPWVGEAPVRFLADCAAYAHTFTPTCVRSSYCTVTKIAEHDNCGCRLCSQRC